MVFSKEIIAQLDDTIAKLMCPGKGLMLVDNDFSNLIRLIDAAELPVGCVSQLRFLMGEIPTMKNYISGVLFTEDCVEEELNDKYKRNRFSVYRMLPGIKFASCYTRLWDTTDEFVAEGLDRVYEKIHFYYHCGFRFFEFSAAVKTGSCIPTDRCISANADVLARFAAMCQSEGIVPILELGLSWEGCHTLYCCKIVTEEFLGLLMKALGQHGAYIKGLILKPYIVTWGSHLDKEGDVKFTALATLTALRNTVPPAVPGIVFSSDIYYRLIIRILKKMNLYHGFTPWHITYCFGNLLFYKSLLIWSKYPHDLQKPARKFIKTLKDLRGCAMPSDHYFIDSSTVRVPREFGLISGLDEHAWEDKDSCMKRVM